MGLDKIKQKALEYLPQNMLYRLFNAGVVGVVLYDFVQNPTPKRAVEYLPDVAIHAVEMIFPNSDSKSINEMALAANALRGIQAVVSLYTNVSEIPRTANLLDIPNHIINVYHRWKNISAIIKTEESPHPEPVQSELNKKSPLPF